MRQATLLMRIGSFALIVSLTLSCYSADRSVGERALIEGRVDEAITILSRELTVRPTDGATHLLLCRAYYAEDQSDHAVTECEAALRNGGDSNSEAHDWMGRAYGMKANHAGPLSGYGLAKKVKAEFERAVSIDPANAAAVNDLSEYYVAAPGLVGGGTDKALALADRVLSTLPQSTHRIRALVAQKNKDFTNAEREFQMAAAVAGRADAWVDLAAFYQRRAQADSAVAALHKATEADKQNDGSLLDVAVIYEELHRETVEAIRVIKTYLASSAKNDGSPAFRAHFVLGKLLATSKDGVGALQEYRIALSMFSKYEPARKALESK